MASSMYNIEKLNESNYDAWRIQMESVLVCQDLWCYVSGECIKPERTENNQSQIDVWVKKDQKAKANIILSITPMQILHIKNSATARDAWDALSRIHKPKGPARKVTLYKSLLGMKMNETDNVQQYVCKFCESADKLSEVGVEVQKESLVIMLLASLPKSFENLVVALESRDELPTLDAVKIKLIEEGERRKESFVEPTTEDNAQAYMLNASKKNNSASKGTNSKTKRDLDKRHLTCYNCGRKGHFASQCREKSRNKNVNKNDNTNNNDKRALFAAISNGLFATMNNVLDEDTWCIDSGATSHLCCKREMFTQLQPHDEKITLAGENQLQATGKGEVEIKISNVMVNLKDVLFVPGIQFNFISVAKVISKDYTVLFNDQSAIIRHKYQNIILHAKRIGDLFILQSQKNKVFYSSGNLQESMKWHRRYGHLNFDSMRQLVNDRLIKGMNVNLTTDLNCSVCVRSKCTQKPFQNSTSRAKEILQIIHTDLCGPISKTSIGGAKYVLTFIDDYSRYVFVYFLSRKDQVLNKFKEFKAMIEKQSDKSIKTLRSDNGTEFMNNEFSDYLKENGIVRQLTVPYTPQQNGVAERMNRTLIEMARCMLLDAELDESLWAEAVATAAYIRNRAPTRALNNMTPFEAWNGHKPSVAHLKIFGSKVVALNKKHKGKFEPRGKEYILVGYSETSKAYRLYDTEVNKLTLSRDVYVTELGELKHPKYSEKGALNKDELVVVGIPAEINNVPESPIFNAEIVNDSETPDNYDDDEYVPAGEDNVETESGQRGPGRPRIIRTGAQGRPRKQYHMLNLAISEVPTTVSEALSGKYAKEWKASMQEEYQALINNNTWQLTTLPSNQKAIGNKWVFTVKRDKDGNVERFKSRLVAKGCSQVYGMNYTDTYSPVARYETLRLIFAIAAECELYMDQLDVTTAYLNSELDEDVYLKQPAEFVNQEYPDHVLKLNKALYGLKQSGRQWNIKLDNILRDIGFIPCTSEPCVYTNHHDDRINIIVVYVDDLLIACTNKNEMTEFKNLISNQVSVVDKGPVSKFLSIEFDREGETGAIGISQRNQIRKLLDNYNMEHCRTVSVPLDPGHQVKCENKDCRRVEQTEYQSLIGSLMYIAICTRPDILHSVCKLSQRNSEPHHEHLAAAKRILKYLSSTIDKQLLYRKTGKPIECFVDADWGSDIVDRKSYTGYVFLFAGAVVSYESKKQSAVALSSTEAEYMALSSAVKGATYLRKLVKEMKLEFPKAVVINGDNLSAQNMVKNPVYHSRSKHIDIKYHHIREVYKSGEIQLEYCCTNEMVADVLTKNLSKSTHEKFTTMMGLC